MKVIDHIKGNTSAQSDKSQSVNITTNVAGISSSPEDLHYGLSPAKKVQIRSQYLTQLRELQKLCDEGSLNLEEFTEEKRRIMATLRAMN